MVIFLNGCAHCRPSSDTLVLSKNERSKGCTHTGQVLGIDCICSSQVLNFVIFFTSRNCHFRLFLGGFLISNDMQDDASGNGQNWAKNLKWPFFRVFLGPYFPNIVKLLTF